MGFKTQRQYESSITSYEDVKEAVKRNRGRVTKCDLQPEDDKGNFTFYLKKYPDVRIQVTSKQRFVKLHGLKPFKFLLDLKVIRELTSLLGEFYPHGIDFKFNKETISWHDKDEIIKELKGVNELKNHILFLARTDRKKFRDLVESIWKEIKTDSDARNDLAETANNFFAKTLCENGFRCKPNGTIKLHCVSSEKDMYPILRQNIQFLLESGFLED